MSDRRKYDEKYLIQKVSNLKNRDRYIYGGEEPDIENLLK